MKRYKAPWGNGFYDIGVINGKWCAVIYESEWDNGYQIEEDSLDDLCERIANIYF